MRRDWRTPLNIPEGKIGDWEIKHNVVPAGEKVMLANWRNLIFGQKAEARNVVFDIPTRWHLLLESGGRWMSDWPVEQRQLDESLRGVRGRVLVGGLGVGYVTTVLQARRQVKKVVTVELQEEVIKLVWPHTKNTWVATAKVARGRTGAWRGEVVQQDLFEYLKSYKGEPFDYAFYDIWQGDGEQTFFDTVVPLRKLSEGKVRTVLCWNEDIMRGQLAMSVVHRLLFHDHPETMPKSYTQKLWEYDGTDSPWHNWLVPFFQWHREAKPSSQVAQDAARHYAAVYGLGDWERLFHARIAG